MPGIKGDVLKGKEQDRNRKGEVTAGRQGEGPWTGEGRHNVRRFSFSSQAKLKALGAGHHESVCAQEDISPVWPEIVLWGCHIPGWS